MNEFEQSLFAKGYVHLPMGSYYQWISKRWHEMFVRRGLVQRNFYGQYTPNRATLSVFSEWVELYDKTMHDKDFPKSNAFLTLGELEKIRLEVI